MASLGSPPNAVRRRDYLAMRAVFTAATSGAGHPTAGHLGGGPSRRHSGAAGGVERSAPSVAAVLLDGQQQSYLQYLEAELENDLASFGAWRRAPAWRLGCRAPMCKRASQPSGVAPSPLPFATRSGHGVRGGRVPNSWFNTDQV